MKTLEQLSLYAVYHLNIAYSSIEEESRKTVIEKCYWPLLRLVEDFDLPFGIEASGYTLEVIQEIAPLWISKFKELIHNNKCELVGSGYTQMIGPLVPAEVNKHNQKLGLDVYKKLLDIVPNIALVNEQAYSAGMVEHYLDAGYRAIVMEWNNPFKYHPEWGKGCVYLPQRALGTSSKSIPLIWNHSIGFQKFQRYVHGEMDIDEYMEYLAKHLGDSSMVFPVYTNDVEVFDFRPGRYHTEASLHDEGEWTRIRKLFANIKSDNRFKIIFLREVLDFLDAPGAGNLISLESPQVPVPVKKQEKYNITRWAITGVDDLGINTLCYQIYNSLIKLEASQTTCSSTIEDYWKELCYLWSSDFRTHITGKRWEKYQKRLRKMVKNISELAKESCDKNNEPGLFLNFIEKNDLPKPVQNGSFLTVETEKLKLRLNCRRGLVIDALYFKDLSETPLLGTLTHGYYDDIALGADYYSGHTIIEIPGSRRVTDLTPVSPVVTEGVLDNDSCYLIKTVVPMMELGEIVKTLCVYKDKPRVDIHYQFNMGHLQLCTFRTGIITVNPESFDKETLFYRTHNGGFQPETFSLGGHQNVSHDDPVSALASAKQALGATEGCVELGDEKKSVLIKTTRDVSAVIPMIRYCKVDDTFFCRLMWSVNEIDDTSKVKVRETYN